MINLFTYLSFTNISIGQLYQTFIIALLAVIILFSTYFSINRLPASVQIKDAFSVLYLGFVTIIFNAGLFLVFLYLTKKSFGTSVIWFPVFSFIVHVLDLAAQGILASALMVSVQSHKHIKKWQFTIVVGYLTIIALMLALYFIPQTSRFTYKFLMQTNYLILFSNILFIIVAFWFFRSGNFKQNTFLNLSIISLVLANIYHSITIIYPFTIRYLIMYNMLIILAYLAIEVFIFYEIIKELSKTKTEVEGLNSELEAKIKDRTQELFNSNKELFQTNYMLHQEKEKLNNIIENLEEGIIVSNVSNKILLINSSAKKLLDIDTHVVGGNITEILPDSQYIQEINNIILKKVRLITKEISIVHKNNERIFLHVRSSLSADSKGNIIGIITLLRNITKEMEIENLKSGFLKTISHELKTPLTNIIGFTETLFSERRGKLNEDQKNFSDIILQESLHLNKLINDLLEFTKLTSNKISLTFEEVSIKSVIADIVDSFRPQANAKNVEIIFDDSANLPSIQADREKINKAFLNIISNAMYYTDKGYVKIEFFTEKNKIVTKISDTGIGIAKTDQERIFDNFFQLNDGKDGKRSGLGLGLSIAKDIINLHDGRIWVESNPGEGSIFYVELPVAR
ncbi:MAG: ATP-binding protein [Candidatus Margulisbacteria bacterium]|nr:ATP-binding protein [Candidatus Margulisiibacteriota bacterium]